MTKENGDLSIKALITIVGGFLAVVISLSIILGWKFDASIGTQVQTLKKENEEIYVRKDLYVLQIKTLNEKLKAIGQAVGARFPREIP